MGPVRAIRAKCLDCAGGMKEVRQCSNESCPLHPYRMGRNPNRAGIGGRQISKSCPENPHSS
jgi:hypothetical protein